MIILSQHHVRIAGERNRGCVHTIVGTKLNLTLGSLIQQPPAASRGKVSERHDACRVSNPGWGKPALRSKITGVVCAGHAGQVDVFDDAIEAMKRIKRALDPNNILNPGKIFP